MSGMFGSSPPPPPLPQAPPRMPDALSPEVLEAKRIARMNALNRAGRESTILTEPDNRGGSSGDYSRKTLGGS